MNGCRGWRPVPAHQTLTCGLIGVRLPVWVVVILAAVVGGCSTPKAAWFQQPTSDAPTRSIAFLVVDRGAITASDPGADDGLEAVDEFEEFDDLEEELADQMIAVPDPLEGWNRAMFQFNDGVYHHVAKPVLEGYAKLVPEDARIAIRHSFTNLGMPARLVNCLLQGRWEAAGVELRRFGINTTVGILGFSDAAQAKYGLDPVQADMGQTLAVYGLGDGCYLVWPILGPSTVRDTAGAVPDMFLDPLGYVRPWPAKLGVSSVKVINNGSLQLGIYEAMTSDAIDPYVAVRQAYIQYRKKQIQKNQPIPEHQADPSKAEIIPRP